MVESGLEGKWSYRDEHGVWLVRFWADCAGDGAGWRTSEMNTSAGGQAGVLMLGFAMPRKGLALTTSVLQCPRIWQIGANTAQVSEKDDH
jgi:hypothetical protein